MSESEAHRTLVRTVADKLRVLYPGASLVVDIPLEPGAPVPPTIGGFRPDVTLRGPTQNAIAEAKTDSDLETQHTHDQVTSFITFLDHSPGALFVLSVSARRADRAKTLLRFAYRQTRPSRTQLAVYDQCDLWMLRGDGLTWDLSAPEKAEYCPWDLG